MIEPVTEDAGDSIPLGRGVFSSRNARRAQRRGEIHVRVFIDPRSPRWSVDRLDRASVTVMAEIGDRRGADRDPPRRLYGWAVVTHAAAERMRRRVEMTPQPDNPYHADVVLPKWPEDIEEREQLCVEHARDLAQSASFRDRSDDRTT